MGQFDQPFSSLAAPRLNAQLDRERSRQKLNANHPLAIQAAHSEVGSQQAQLQALHQMNQAAGQNAAGPFNGRAAMQYDQQASQAGLMGDHQFSMGGAPGETAGQMHQGVLDRNGVGALTGGGSAGSLMAQQAGQQRGDQLRSTPLPPLSAMLPFTGKLGAEGLAARHAAGMGGQGVAATGGTLPALGAAPSMAKIGAPPAGGKFPFPAFSHTPTLASTTTIAQNHIKPLAQIPESGGLLNAIGGPNSRLRHLGPQSGMSTDPFGIPSFLEPLLGPNSRAVRATSSRDIPGSPKRAGGDPFGMPSFLQPLMGEGSRLRAMTPHLGGSPASQQVAELPPVPPVVAPTVPPPPVPGLGPSAPDAVTSGKSKDTMHALVPGTHSRSVPDWMKAEHIKPYAMRGRGYRSAQANDPFLSPMMQQGSRPQVAAPGGAPSVNVPVPPEPSLPLGGDQPARPGDQLRAMAIQGKKEGWEPRDVVAMMEQARQMDQDAITNPVHTAQAKHLTSETNVNDIRTREAGEITQLESGELSDPMISEPDKAILRAKIRSRNRAATPQPQTVAPQPGKGVSSDLTATDRLADAGIYPQGVGAKDTDTAWDQIKTLGLNKQVPAGNEHHADLIEALTQSMGAPAVESASERYSPYWLRMLNPMAGIPELTAMISGKPSPDRQLRERAAWFGNRTLGKRTPLIPGTQGLSWEDIVGE